MFSENPFSIARIKNRRNGKTYCVHGKQTLLVRTPLEISEPAFLTRMESVSSDPSGSQFTATDETREYKAEVHFSDSGDGIRFGLRVSSPKPIWLVEWQLSSLLFDEVIVPALGGQVLTKEMPPDTTLSYKYPFWWNAQFVIGSVGANGLWLRTKDAEPNFRLLRVRREGNGFSLSVGFEADAPFRSKILEAAWYLDGFEGSWKVPVDLHRAWLEKAFHLIPLSENPQWPEWAGKINFILEIWGIGKHRPEPLHTFADMQERLKRWRKLHSPEQTLVYLPGFAEHGIDSRAPSYCPSKELGGEKGFKEFMDAAHDLGYHVMIHTNVLAMTFSHPLYPKFKRHQVVDGFNRPQGWALDIDGDWLTEPYFAYINPGAKAWGDLMEQAIGDLISKYNVDAVFLDQTLLAFNVNRGPNFVMGMRNHIKRLAHAFPKVLFAGEGLHEQILSVLPMAQIHGIDSIAEVHGMEGRRRWRKVHPVSVYLFGKYTKFVAHLLTKHPANPMFRWQESAYAKLGVIPALALYDREQPMDTPEVRKMIQRAQSLL